MEFKKIKLNQFQRIIVAIIYLISVFVCVKILGGNIIELTTGSTDESIWFYSGILLIVMGQYVTEPFFSTPADAFANSITAILALTAINDKNMFSLFWMVFYFCLGMAILSILTIALKNIENRFSKFLYLLVNKLGSSKVLFSVVYLLSAYSYFFKTGKNNYLFVSITIWVCIIFFQAAEKIVFFFSNLIKTLKNNPSPSYIGNVIKTHNNYFVTIEIDKDNPNIEKIKEHDLIAIKNLKGCYNIGVIVNIKYHIDSCWADVIILENEGKALLVECNEFGGFSTNSSSESAFLLESESLAECITEKIKSNEIITNINDFVGYIKPESDINIINFSICSNELRIKEGCIVRVRIKGENVLYQVINGVTKETTEDQNNTFGYICGKARKLGMYSYEKKALISVPWVPNVNERVYLNPVVEAIDLKDIAQTAIGRLPETDMRIPINDINSLVTHNTAVLGILGVGKSCLTFELIKKIVDNSDCKVICIDITNQYASEQGLYSYINSELILNDFDDTKLEELNKTSLTTGSDSKPSNWGNISVYEKAIDHLIKNLYTTDKRILIVNPEKHIVTKAATQFKIQELSALTAVEKTRIISERALNYCMEQGQIDSARCCIVLEEAHSLVPEWNSVSSPGDQTATNGTAKVILQGRKYGLGCILVTQRTANITKSILNQCNTIFAMRVYDDTGKAFLENYIGCDYSSTLPTLEERHAIVTGKSIGLKQPIVMQLNDRKFFSTKMDCC